MNRYPASIVVRAGGALAALAALSLCFVPSAQAQTAKKLKCKGCVKSKQIKNGRIKAKDLAPDAVFRRTLLVSPVRDGSDPSANGQELLDALAILDAVAPAPSADNPWLVKLEPGVYDVGEVRLEMKPFVDIEGSGEATTLIRGGETIVVFGADDSELRFVSVENTGAGEFASVAIGTGDTSFRVTHVTALARDPGDSGQTLGVSADGTAVLTDVTTTATDTNGQAFGVAVNGGTVELVNVVATASGNFAGQNRALFITSAGDAVVVARNSVLVGDPAILSGGTANLISTQIDGDVIETLDPTFHCVGSYDAAFAELGPDCL